jgi:hypothetical protein
MSRRYEPPTSVRPERTLTRSGLWATGSVQLALPFEASGLSERITANGRLRVTPDFDVLSWLCERWQTRPTDSGVIKPTLYEIGSALYGTSPSGEHYRILRASLDRLAWVSVTIDSYDMETGTFRDNWVSRSNLMSLGRATDDPHGLQRPAIELARWLRTALSEEQVVRVHWPTLRAFKEQQTLAKRLWLYLAAERWTRMTGTSEGTWIAVGDRLYAALGMSYAQHRQARAALARACVTVRKVDPRYAAGILDVVKLGSSWRVNVERPTFDVWRAQRDEQANVRAVIAASLATDFTPRRPQSAPSATVADGPCSTSLATKAPRGRA